MLSTASTILKTEMAKDILDDPKYHLATEVFLLNCQIHGVKIEFNFSSERLRNSVQNLIPHTNTESNFNPEIKVNWLTSNNEAWDLDENPDLIFEKWGPFGGVRQRDFIGIQIANNEYTIVTRDFIGDGFYNALRWFLPSLLLEKNFLVLHSSCVVSPDGSANFFLGHSGAGKSTVATLAEGRTVLGDDMNGLKIEFENEKVKLFAEAVLLGGNPKFQGPFGKNFPVKGFYWLRQSAKNQVTKLSSVDLAVKIMASCPLSRNLDDPKTSLLLLNAAKLIVSSGAGYLLEFKKNNHFWEHVDGN